MQKPIIYFSLLTLFGPAQNFASDIAIISSHHHTVPVSIQSWKTLRDLRIIKQDLDYSCGAA